MNRHSHVYRRRSLCLKDYDYSQPGQYFITIVTRNGECLFGEVKDGEMVLNDAGRLIMRWYSELGKKFTNAECSDHVVMPNHFHRIIELTGNQLKQVVGADLRVCPEGESGEHTGSPLRAHKGETI